MGWDESVLVSSQVIAKSAKLLPVMAIGRLLGDKHCSVRPAPSPQGQPPRGSWFTGWDLGLGAVWDTRLSPGIGVEGSCGPRALAIRP